MIKKCDSFTDCISEISDTQIGNAKNIDAVMPMYNFLEYSDNYSKHLEVYGNTIGVNHFQILMEQFLIVMLIIIRVLLLNSK